MATATARMVCLICGCHWEAEAVLQEDGAYLVTDDLCPECAAQGETVEVVLPERSGRPRGKRHRADAK